MTFGNFPNYLQFEQDGVDLGGPDVDTVNIQGPVWRATRGVGANANVLTIGSEGLLDPATAAVLGADDGEHGALFTTVQGFINELLPAVSRGGIDAANALVAVNLLTTFDATGLVTGTKVFSNGRDTAEDGGGGMFTYSSSSTQTADDVLVFAPIGGGRLFREGWTVFGFAGPIQAKWAGVKQDGTTNDTAAWARLGVYLQANGGHMIAGAGVSIVGTQTFAGAGGLGYAYRPGDILKIYGCTKPITLEFHGTVMKLAAGLKFGSFDPVTGAVYNPILPFTNQNYGADVGQMIEVHNNVSVRIIGDLELDGNLQNIVLGGKWGDIDYQRMGYGVHEFGNLYFEMSGQIYLHHHATDGYAIAHPGLTLADPIRQTLLIGVKSLYNARQGLSVTGCNNILALNCEHSHTGKSTFGSSPGAGIDFEAEGGSIIRGVMLLNCNEDNNAAAGILADSGDTADIQIIGGRASGTTTYPLWLRKPRITVTGKLIVGSTRSSYGSSAVPGDATKYIRSKFTDDVTLSPTGVVFVSGYVVSEDSQDNVLFDDCEIQATQTKVIYANGGAILRNTRIRVSVGTDKVADHTTIGILTNAKIDGLTVTDEIVANIPTDAYSITVVGADLQGNNYATAGRKIKWHSYAAAGATGYLGNFNPEQRAAPCLSLIAGNGANLLGYYGTLEIFAGPTAPATGTFKKGAITKNSNPAVGNPKGWVCTVAGTPGTWVSEGNL